MYVVKSKSSNSAIASKTENVGKKSRSHGEIQPLLIKKRGVYVENKFPKLISKEVTEIEPNSKPHTHIKAGLNKFPSFHTTLTKLTAVGTQFSSKQYDQSCRHRKQIQTTKKYKSRVLNQVSYEEEKKPIIVLKSGKDVIIRTPSNYSASENTSNSLKWATHKNPIKNTFDSKSDKAEGSKKTKLTFQDDPETVVGAVKEKEDKKIYDMFVDLLKTTISVCNVTTDCQNCENSDGVTKNLNVVDEVYNSTDSLKTNNRTIKYTSANKQLNYHNQYAKIVHNPRKEKIKSKSFVYTLKSPKKVSPKSDSVNAKGIPKRESKRTRYKKFMSFLKEQLRMDICDFEEPDNLFDALKVLAKNKRRRERTPHFYDINTDFEKSECKFKVRKIISPKSKSKKRRLPKTTSERNDYYYNFSNSEEILSPSYHSIKVFGFNYKETPITELQDRQKQVMFTHNKASSVVDDSVDLNSPKLSNYSFQSVEQYSDFETL